MERYKLILRHENIDENNNIADIEDPYEVTVMISNLYSGIKYFKTEAIKEMCNKLIKFIEEEEDVHTETDKE